MDFMFENASAFNQNLSSWNVENVWGMYEMFTNSALSTYNYNAILDARSQQNVQSWLNFGAYPTEYGGCEVNAAAGIAGHAALMGTYGWGIFDGGLAAPCDPAFITTWRTTSANEMIQIPTSGTGYNFTVEWGDGTSGSYAGTAPSPTHTYATAGDHIVSIKGDFPRIAINGHPLYRNKIRSVDQWGSIEWTSMESAFYGCENLQVLATDAPDLSKVTDMNLMFRDATNLTGNFDHWDVSNVTEMTMMFTNATNFNQPLN